MTPGGAIGRFATMSSTVDGPDPRPDRGEVTSVTDEGARGDAAGRRRFVLAVVAFAVFFTALGRIYGEDIALELQKTPTTTLGWRLVRSAHDGEHSLRDGEGTVCSARRWHLGAVV